MVEAGEQRRRGRQRGAFDWSRAPDDAAGCVTAAEWRREFMFKRDGRGDVMSASGLKGHIEEPPLGGESGSELEEERGLVHWPLY